jgi:hypothetical protein
VEAGLLDSWIIGFFLAGDSKQYAPRKIGFFFEIGCV